MRTIRILPLTIFLAVVAFAFKTGQTAHDGKEMFGKWLVSAVQAEEAAAPAKPEAGAPAHAAENTGHEAAPAEGEKKEEKKAEPPTQQEPLFSPTEIDVLQQLSKRREKLDEWEKNITLKETLLNTTEKRIDEKLVQMDELKKDLAEMLVQYNEQENAKIKSLVSIYENMKPREAARIFDEVEMPILLLVIDKMSEKKAAPILASMDPKKAKALTVQLAEQRRDKNTPLESKALEAAKPK